MELQARSETIKRYGPNAIPQTSTSIDWPFDYDELEPWYDKVEYSPGVSGQAGNVKGIIDQKGNIFEGPRKRPYPLPPLRRSGWTDMMDAPHASIGWKPYPGPTGIRSQATTASPAAPTAASAAGRAAGRAPRCRPTSTTSRRPRRPATSRSSAGARHQIEVDKEGRASA